MARRVRKHLYRVILTTVCWFQIKAQLGDLLGVNKLLIKFLTTANGGKFIVIFCFMVPWYFIFVKVVCSQLSNHFWSLSISELELICSACLKYFTKLFILDFSNPRLNPFLNSTLPVGKELRNNLLLQNISHVTDPIPVWNVQDSSSFQH